MTVIDQAAPPQAVLRSGPVIAVTPIATPPGDADLAFLAEGLHEDICGALSRFRAFTVIAPMSAAAVARLPEPEIAERVGATHIVRSRLVRTAPDRLQLRLGLATRTAQVLSECIEIPADRVLAVHDEVVARVAASFAARIDDAALAEARRGGESLEAYRLVLQGMALLRRGEYDADVAARALFEQALALDPVSTRARVGIALSHFNEWSCQFWDHAEEAGKLAYATAHEALALDEHDGLLHLVIGKVHLMRRDYERAEWYFDRALALSPHDAEVLIQLSMFECFLGRPESGVDLARRAMALNPYHPSAWHSFSAFAELMARDFEAAIRSQSRSDSHPFVDAPACWAIALAHAGHVDEARRQMAVYDENFRAKILFGRDPAPGEAVRWFLDYNPFRRPEDTALCVEGFRLAGTEPEAPPAAPPVAAGEALLVREGAGWRVSFGGAEARLGALKGLEDISRLLVSPGEETHCLDLADRAEETFAGDATLDAKARGALKARIRDLQEELADAEDMNDIGRAERARTELETLVDSLGRALGLGGRTRRLGGLAERARTTVTWRIRHAIRQVGAAHPPLGRHLQHSIRTGNFCSYAPEHAVSWRLDAGARSPIGAV